MVSLPQDIECITVGTMAILITLVIMGIAEIIITAIGSTAITTILMSTMADIVATMEATTMEVIMEDTTADITTDIQVVGITTQEAHMDPLLKDKLQTAHVNV